MLSRAEPLLIHLLLNKFEIGDMSLLELISDNIDFRIDHYADDADIDWQACDSKVDFIALLRRLTSDIFPQGTKIVHISSTSLENGWHLTTFEQQFFYGVKQAEVFSRTFIISHETNGKIDYFRENVIEVKEL